MKRFWYFAVVLALILVISACNKKIQPEGPAAEAQVLVSSVTGEALLQHANGGQKQQLAAGQTLIESDIISSGEGSLVVITLEEGKEIHIGENTIFALSAIRRDATGNVNILALKQGSIVNIVDTPLAESDVYEVHTPRLVMSVRGTSNYMESNEHSDTVIGITGQTHVFSDGGSANVVPGMMAEIDRNTTSPQLLPFASESLPALASNYAKERDISYDALAQDDIAQHQQGADDFRPSTQFSNDFNNNLFNDDSISIPESGSSSSASASDMSSAAPSESSSSDSESGLESSPAAISAVVETVALNTTPVHPTPTVQTPLSSTVSGSSSKAESSSSVSSGSRNNDSYASDLSSSRSSGSRNNNSSSSSRSSSSVPSSSSAPPPSSSESPSSSSTLPSSSEVPSSSEDPSSSSSPPSSSEDPSSSSTPPSSSEDPSSSSPPPSSSEDPSSSESPPSYNHIHIKYTNFSDETTVTNKPLDPVTNGYYRVVITPIDSIDKLTMTMLPVPDNYCVVSFTASATDDHIFVNARVLPKTEPIVIRFYKDTTYSDGLAYTTAEELFESNIADVVQAKFNANVSWTATLQIKSGITIDSRMLLASGVYPAGVSGGSATGLSLWIPIESKPSTYSTEPPSVDLAEPPSDGVAATPGVTAN